MTQLSLHAILVATLIVSQAAEASVCEPYVGTNVTPISFDKAIVPFATAKPKDEYETTQAYQGRVASLASTSPLVIATPRMDGGPFAFRYDADVGALSVPAFAFQGAKGFDPVRGFIGTQVDFIGRANLNAVVSWKSVPLGSRLAQNAFGATVRVSKSKTVEDVIFDGTVSGRTASLFPNGSFEEAGKIKMTPEEAKRLKPLLKLAYVIEPQAPYYLKTSYQAVAPTLDDPRDVTLEARVLLADIQCALVLDDTGTVRGAFSTN